MELHLVWMIIVYFHTGSSQELLTPFREEMMALEGEDVTLSCNYSGSVDYLYWYQQKSSSPPEHLIGEYSEKSAKWSLIHDRDSKEFHLQISSAHLSDSAVYYCALQNVNKILFGAGTSLTIEPKEDVEPSFYKLNDDKNNRTACLATGFTRYDSLKNETLFKGTEAVRAKEDDGSEPVYSQVAFFNGNASDTCVEAGSGGCGGSLDPDPMVNLVSLTVVVLRLIFIKTVIFNVLMTFRLWISQ